jgi:hypothetical protein
VPFDIRMLSNRISVAVEFTQEGHGDQRRWTAELTPSVTYGSVGLGVRRVRKRCKFVSFGRG